MSSEVDYDGSEERPPLAVQNLCRPLDGCGVEMRGKLEQLKIVETETMKTVRDLLAKLSGSQEDDAKEADK